MRLISNSTAAAIARLLEAYAKSLAGQDGPRPANQRRLCAVYIKKLKKTENVEFKR